MLPHHYVTVSLQYVKLSNYAATALQPIGLSLLERTIGMTMTNGTMTITRIFKDEGTLHGIGLILQMQTMITKDNDTCR